ncbi:MAG: hypothetical protein CM1200mP16_01850 [Nitrospina sp.]|nr:MAG: hypothetical protein CM1200mP16_01850 [Nitrospina sp.]
MVTLDASQVPETMEAVKQVLRRNHNLSVFSEDDFRFVTPEGIMEWVTESAQAMNRMLILISTVSLLVGGVVIMNILLVSIRERVKEIGIRRCFGARNFTSPYSFYLNQFGFITRWSFGYWVGTWHIFWIKTF